VPRENKPTAAGNSLHPFQEFSEQDFNSFGEGTPARIYSVS